VVEVDRVGHVGVLSTLDVNLYLALLRNKMILLGNPEKPLQIIAFTLIAYRRYFLLFDLTHETSW
jgi:hypothetical protein